MGYDNMVQLLDVNYLKTSGDWRVTALGVTFASWIFWNICHYVLAPWTFARIVPGWKTWSVKKQVDLQTRFVAFWHAMLILPLAFYGTFFDAQLHADKVFASAPIATWTLGFSLGFFIWDSVICVLWVKDFGVGFLVHGLSCLFLYGYVVLDSFVMYFALAALLFEASTPLLNLRFLMIALNHTKGPLFLAVNLSFAAVFFISRIVFGIACQYDFYSHILVDKRVTWVQFGVCAPFCSALMLLNIYWFYAMIVSFTKKRDPKQPKQPSNPEASSLASPTSSPSGGPSTKKE